MESAEEGISKLDINGDSVSSVPNLYNNLSLLSPDQSHLFSHWREPGVDDGEKKAFFDQVARLNSSYPGGLASYIKTARGLLADSKMGKNPFDGFTPYVPTGENLSYGDETFMKFEEAGIKEAQNAAFVLLAGGLGERLGYNGIKVYRLTSKYKKQTSPGSYQPPHSIDIKLIFAHLFIICCNAKCSAS